MNQLGFGFLRLPHENNVYDWDTICHMVDLFLEKGGRYFDTCYTYLNGQSEAGIRKCVAERYPRNSFQLAEKLPGYLCQSYEDCQRYFEQELERCGVEYFDVYMLHWLNEKHYAIAERYEQFRFLREKKAEGTAKRIGFSYHDSAALLDRILTEHPEVDVVQLQINYLDWDSAGIESRKCYETCVRHGKRVIVMEPVKGGTLAALPEEAEALLRSVHPDWTPAEWALRFVRSLPAVEICLSGMSAVSHVEENMRAAAPLQERELACLRRVCSVLERKTAVACTGCRYCTAHCPKGILIPDCFKMFNEIARYPKDSWKIRPAYQQLILTSGKASDCVGCRSCIKHCPQKLNIPEYLRQVAEMLEA